MTVSKLQQVMMGTGVALLGASAAMAHPGHISGWASSTDAPKPVHVADATTPPAPVKGVTGEGELKFELLHTSKDLPEPAMKGLDAAHGGFAVDRRPGKGEVYFALPQVGIIRIAADLDTIEVLPTDAGMAAANMHNTTIWYNKKDKAFLSFPGNDTSKVYTTGTDGGLLFTLDAPTAETKFDSDVVTKYFAEGGKFIPTDVEVLDKRFYITTGYSPLDWVLTADVKLKEGGSAMWNPFAFGGKGDGPGQFGTGHGITIAPDGTITVADRPNSELESFTPDGKHLGKLDLPKGCLPCDVDYQSGYTIVGCLEGPDKEKGAPVYIVNDGAVVSTIMIKEDLGLERFTHIHNAVMVEKEGVFYIIAQAWNPGDFAILKQVK